EGEGHLRISEAPQEPAAHALSRRTLPIHGELNFAFSQSGSRFDRSSIQFGQSTLQFGGTESARQPSQLRIEVRSDDLSDLDFLVPDLKGKATLFSVVEGTRAQPTARGNFVVDRASYKTYSVDRAQGQFGADKRAIDLRNVDLVRQGSQIKVGGQIFLDPSNLTPTGDLHLLAGLKDARVEDVLAVIGQSYPVSGIVSGDFMATGKYPRIGLQGVADVRNGRIWDQRY